MTRQENLIKIRDEAMRLTAKESLTKEEITQLDALTNEGEAITAEIEKELALRQRAGDLVLSTNVNSKTSKVIAESATFEATGETVTLSKDKRLAIAASGTLSAKQMSAISDPAYEAKFANFLRNPHKFAMNETNLDDGGALVPAVMMNEIYGRPAAPTDVLNNVNRIAISSDSVAFPRFNGGDTVASSGLAVQWPGESGAATADTSLENLSDVVIPIHRGTFEVVIGRALFEDPAVDVMAWMTKLVGDCYNLTMENQILNGTGVAKPMGIITRAGSGLNDVATYSVGTTYSTATIWGLLGDLPDAHDGNASFVTRRATLFGKILPLTDSVGQTIFASGLNANPSTLFNYPIIRSGYMPAYASAAKSIIFGDLRELYTFVENVAMTIEPLPDPAYQRADKIGFLVRFRVGGDVVGNWAARIALQS